MGIPRVVPSGRGRRDPLWTLIPGLRPTTWKRNLLVAVLYLFALLVLFTVLSDVL